VNCPVTYRHVLVPTDGSSRSEEAIRTAVQLARKLGARITGIFVIAEGVPTAFSGAELYGSGVMSREYRKLAKLEANRALAQVERSASCSGVPARIVQRLARHPWRAILRAARSGGCDLIVMASHGRGSVRTALLGSQTTNVLAHSKIPVLVCR
jgi:nucleotide-binding universal stress UspA family protein